MGNKFSTPQLQRKKSLSAFGRSSQRSLFQKTKAKLKAIDKRLESESNHEEIRKDLESIEKDLMSVSTAVKEKNKEKYEDIVELFVEIKDKVKVQVEEVNITDDNNKVDDDVAAINPEEVEIRKPIEPYVRPASPSIKFGVQVMPTVPRVSQEMLKRNTVPNNEAAKVEFQEIRGLSSETKVILHSTTTTRVEENGQVREFTRVSIEERPFQVKSDLNQVDRIRTIVDELENMLKYFHGVKGDEDYQTLRQKLVQNLAKLDNIESQDNPVIKQEKKILIERIQELLKILERISEPVVRCEEEHAESVNPENLVGTTI